MNSRCFMPIPVSEQVPPSQTSAMEAAGCDYSGGRVRFRRSQFMPWSRRLPSQPAAAPGASSSSKAKAGSMLPRRRRGPRIGTRHWPQPSRIVGALSGGRTAKSQINLRSRGSLWLSGPLMRFARGDMRDHIVLHKTTTELPTSAAEYCSGECSCELFRF
jgi:hypothetical protein